MPAIKFENPPIRYLIRGEGETLILFPDNLKYIGID
jgi:hypothetical protein